MSRMMSWIQAHPRLAAWLALGLGMNGIVAYEARGVGLTVGQWVALVVATTLVAGLCVWIIGWDEAEGEAPEKSPPTSSPETKN